MLYSSRHIQQLFGISRETVRAWSKEFAPYLSDEAAPEAGKIRQFTDSDMKVFALVAQMKNQRLVFEDIHAALKSGQRADVPEAGKDIVARPTELRAIQKQLVEMVNERDALLAKTQQQQGQIDLLKDQLDQREKEIRQLYRDMARLEAKQGRSE